MKSKKIVAIMIFIIVFLLLCIRSLGLAGGVSLFLAIIVVIGLIIYFIHF